MNAHVCPRSWQPLLASADAASALLGVVVQSTPLLALSGELVEWSYPSPPPPPSPEPPEPSPPPPKLPAVLPPMAHGLDIDSSAALTSATADGAGGTGQQASSHGLALVLSGSGALLAAMACALGAYILLRRARRKAASWPRQMVASSTLPTAVAASVHDLPPLIAPPTASTQDGVIHVQASTLPGYSRLVSPQRGSSSGLELATVPVMVSAAPLPAPGNFKEAATVVAHAPAPSSTKGSSTSFSNGAAGSSSGHYWSEAVHV